MGYARKDVEKTKKIAKKFVRYQEGAELYSIGLTKFQELAKEAKAVYKIDKVALVNCEILKSIWRHSGLRREEKIVEGLHVIQVCSIFFPVPAGQLLSQSFCVFRHNHKYAYT